MPLYLHTFEGTVTDACDPTRLVWFNCRCGYWTDNFHKLRHIPPTNSAGQHRWGCKECGHSGNVCTYSEWLDAMDNFLTDNPQRMYHKEFMTTPASKGGSFERCYGIGANGQGGYTQDAYVDAYLNFVGRYSYVKQPKYKG
jgi:hypothetical protein